MVSNFQVTKQDTLQSTMVVNEIQQIDIKNTRDSKNLLEVSTFKSGQENFEQPFTGYHSKNTSNNSPKKNMTQINASNPARIIPKEDLGIASQVSIQNSFISNMNHQEGNQQFQEQRITFGDQRGSTQPHYLSFGSASSPHKTYQFNKQYSDLTNEQ